MTARPRQAANPVRSPLNWMPLDFVMGRTQALLSGLRNPHFPLGHRCGAEEGASEQNQKSGLWSLCSVVQLRWLFTWFSFFGFLFGCEVVLFSELILFRVT